MDPVVTEVEGQSQGGHPTSVRSWDILIRTTFSLDVMTLVNPLSTEQCRSLSSGGTKSRRPTVLVKGSHRRQGKRSGTKSASFY